MSRLPIPAILLILCRLTFCGGAADAPAAARPGRPPKLSDLFGDDVLARGKGVEVRQSALDEAFVSLKATAAARGQSIPEDRRLQQEVQLLDKLIITQLLTNRVTETDRTNAQALAQKYLAETRKTAVSDEVFVSQLNALGLSMERFNRQLMEQSLADAVIQREVRSKITVTDAQVQDFYTSGTDLLVKTMQVELDKLVRDPDVSPQQVADLKARVDQVKKSNLQRLEQPERVKVAHVFMLTRDRQSEQDLPDEAKAQKRRQMEKIRERAQAGEDFSKLVLEFSEDRAVKETRGEYTFSRKDPFAEEFKAAAFSLSPGKISDVIGTAYGYHVIKLIERYPAQKIELEKIAKDLRDFLTQQEVLKLMPDYFDKLKSEAAVEIVNPKYRITLPKEAESRKPGA